MVILRERIFGDVKYFYLEKSIRAGRKVLKISKFIGKQNEISKDKLGEEIKKFVLEADGRAIKSKVNFLKKRIISLEYPITWHEVEKIEEMNFKYYEIINNLGNENISDLKKRFIANFVFESNAIEGNSLTLKNYAEIIFENRISKGADFREVYDAKNSYNTFSWLFKIRRGIDESLIINIHKNLMKNIDSRVGYKALPNIILGSKLKLSPPEKVKIEMKNLISWYGEQKDKMYPLELAFKFHHKFEKIHPFSDGNGRVGRMLLNYVLLRAGYFPIIIRKTQRQRYLKGLQEADLKSYIPLIRFGLEKYKETYRKFFEIYYKYV